MSYSIEFYRDIDGCEPVKDFLDRLHEEASKDFIKAMRYLRHLNREGTWSGMPHTKHIVNGIWELRPSPWRILFYVGRNGIYVMLHAFRKVTNKTPEREIDIAIKRRDDYRNRFCI